MHKIQKFRSRTNMKSETASKVYSHTFWLWERISINSLSVRSVLAEVASYALYLLVGNLQGDMSANSGNDFFCLERLADVINPSDLKRTYLVAHVI